MQDVNEASDFRDIEDPPLPVIFLNPNLTYAGIDNCHRLPVGRLPVILHEPKLVTSLAARVVGPLLQIFLRRT